MSLSDILIESYKNLNEKEKKRMVERMKKLLFEINVFLNVLELEEQENGLAKN